MRTHEAAKDSGLYTAEDFYALVPDGQKADLIDGVIYVSSPDTLLNDDLTNFLNFLMRGFAEERGLGRVQGSRYAFKLGEHHVPEPDVAFVSSSRLDLVEERWGNGAPDVAVEVVSRDSRTRDYVSKKSLYEEAGVLEYWIVDPRKVCAEFYRLRADRYQLVPLVHDRFFLSEALPGFWLDVEWLLLQPRPSTLQCLQRILAGPPQ